MSADATPSSFGDLRRLVNEVLDYNWHDELCDFEENHKEDGGSHIFRSIVAIHNWFEGENRAPEDFIRDACPCEVCLPRMTRIREQHARALLKSQKQKAARAAKKKRTSK